MKNMKFQHIKYQIWQGICFFIGCVMVFVAFNRSRFFRFPLMEEGFENGNSTTSSDTTSNASSSSSITSTNSGIAGNAQTYAANIKNAFIKNQDMLLISKYRTDYENVILNLDDYINSLMLRTALNIDPSNTTKSIDTLTKLNDTKSALNNVLKFIDSNH